jgi:hypothetical protein
MPSAFSASAGAGSCLLEQRQRLRGGARPDRHAEPPPTSIGGFRTSSPQRCDRSSASPISCRNARCSGQSSCRAGARRCRGRRRSPRARGVLKSTSRDASPDPDRPAASGRPLPCRPSAADGERVYPRIEAARPSRIFGAPRAIGRPELAQPRSSTDGAGSLREFASPPDRDRVVRFYSGRSGWPTSTPRGAHPRLSDGESA